MHERDEYMHFDKQVAHMLEKQQMHTDRKYFLSIADVNLKLSKIHQQIKSDIQVDDYQYATEYVHQYISYTTIWNLKFTLNVENPEIALLQIFHLNYIFQHEPAHKFQQEREELQEIAQQFFALEAFTPDHIEKRLQAMFDYIQSKENKQ